MRVAHVPPSAQAFEPAAVILRNCGGTAESVSQASDIKVGKLLQKNVIKRKLHQITIAGSEKSPPFFMRIIRDSFSKSNKIMSI